MRIFINDYGRFPFTVQLARSLVGRGHQVLYSFNTRDPLRAEVTEADSDRSLEFVGIRTTRPLNKSALFARRAVETEYGELAADAIKRFRPDVVMSANTALDAQRLIARQARAVGAKFVFWLQDLTSIAIAEIIPARLPIIGHLVAAHYLRLERGLLRNSDAIITIAPEFGSQLERWGVDPSRVHIIENWSPLEELPVQPRDNEWARSHGLVGKTCFLYSGSLGFKQNPQMLIDLAVDMQTRADAVVVVCAEGPKVDWLRQRRDELALKNMEIVPFQPLELVPQVLGSADVLLAQLLPSSTAFSIPSKVLTYFCAQRPVLMSVSPNNHASQIVVDNDAGFSAPPDDTAAFLKGAVALADDPELRARMGKSARRYAEAHFRIEPITDAFEAVLTGDTAKRLEPAMA
jgi:colanic acid biosynthesis glycosyl transferase WcaI